MTPIACPQCGSENAWLAAYEGGDPFGAWDLYRCDDCGYEFVANEWWPDCDDDDVCEANEIIDDDDAVFAPPADSRESEPYDVDEHLRILQEEYFELTGTRPNIAPWIPPNLAVNILWTKIGDIRRTRTDARD